VVIKNRFFVRDPDFFQDPRQKIEFFKKQISFQKIPKLKFYYAKWTLQIEVVNGKKHICYCIFSVYLVTGTKNPDISQEETFRISNFLFLPASQDAGNGILPASQDAGNGIA
jgi:hypothetical protein